MRSMTKFMMTTLLTVGLTGLVACQNANQDISQNSNEDISQDIVQETSSNIKQEASQVILAAQSAQTDKVAPVVVNQQSAQSASKLEAGSVISTDLQRVDAPASIPKVSSKNKTVSNDNPPPNLDEARTLKVTPPIKKTRINVVEVQTTPYQNPPKQIALDQVASPSNPSASVDTQTVDTAPVETIVAPVKSWQMDAANSHLKFSALQEGEPFGGNFESFSADIQFHPDNLAGSSVKVTVPISSIEAGSTDRNSTVPDKVWFSVKKFPDAVFTAKTFKSTGGNSYDATGELTMKGISVPLTLPFTLDIDGDTAVMRSQLEINRNDWNIGEKPWNTDEWVSTSVGLDIVVTAQAAP